jgi:hypothetical protein
VSWATYRLCDGRVVHRIRAVSATFKFVIKGKYTNIEGTIADCLGHIQSPLLKVQTGLKKPCSIVHSPGDVQMSRLQAATGGALGVNLFLRTVGPTLLLKGVTFKSCR